MKAKTAERLGFVGRKRGSPPTRSHCSKEPADPLSQRLRSTEETVCAWIVFPLSSARIYRIKRPNLGIHVEGRFQKKSPQTSNVQCVLFSVKSAVSAISIRFIEVICRISSYMFFGPSQTDGAADMKNLLGGKGANLAEMCRLGNRRAAGADDQHRSLPVYPAGSGCRYPQADRG